MAKQGGTPSEALAEIAVFGMQEKKGIEIITMDLRKLKSAFADMFVICHGNSDRQVEAIADGVEEEIRKATGEKPLHREGSEQAEWILLDYVNVVVHIFQKEKRSFYGLEELWGDAVIKNYNSSN
ncbi:MAG: ribosome silencing factor [Bacteroidetes bacterium]|nr:ribosome silencing factor [Bacteroidota bacterium]